MITLIRNNEGKVAGLYADVFGGKPNQHKVSLPYPVPPTDSDWQQWIEGNFGKHQAYQAFLSWAEGKDMAVELADRPDLATPEAKDPDWAKFRVQMMSDAGYNRMVEESENQIAVRRIEMFAAVGGTDMQILGRAWYAAVTALPSPPTTEEIESWNTKAAGAAMPFSFNSQGLMTLS